MLMGRASVLERVMHVHTRCTTPPCPTAGCNIYSVPQLALDNQLNDGGADRLTLKLVGIFKIGFPSVSKACDNQYGQRAVCPVLFATSAGKPSQQLLVRAEGSGLQYHIPAYLVLHNKIFLGLSAPLGIPVSNLSARGPVLCGCSRRYVHATSLERRLSQW